MKSTLSPTDPRHGTQNGYINLHCRCARCRESNRIAHADYMARHPEQQKRHRLAMRLRRERRAKPANRQDPAWVTAMFRSGKWEDGDIEYAATEFPAAVIDAHSYWHSTPGHPPEDLATCGADICARARAANPLLGLVVAADDPAASRRMLPAYLRICPNDREQLIVSGENRVCPVCKYVIVGGAR